MANTHCGCWDGSDLIISKWDELSVIWVNYLESRDITGLHKTPTISRSSHWDRALLPQLSLDPCKDFSKVFPADFVLQSLQAKPVPQLAPSTDGGTTHMTRSQLTPGNREGDSGEQLEQAELCGREEAGDQCWLSRDTHTPPASAPPPATLGKALRSRVPLRAPFPVPAPGWHSQRSPE